MSRTDGFCADVADVGVLRHATRASASHADLVLGTRQQVVANAFQRFTVVHGLPACEKELKHISSVIVMFFRN